MLRPGQALVLISVALLCFGVLMVCSAGLSIGSEQPLELRDVLLGRTGLVAGLAIAMLVAGSMVPLRRVEQARWAPLAIAALAGVCIVLLLLVHVPGIGREVNGARRWITLGPVGFQPSEIAKWSILVILAWHGARRPEAMGRFVRGFAAPMALVGLLCLLIATEDLGTAVLIGAVSMVVLIAAGARIWHAALLLPAAAAAIVAALLHSPYRLERIRAFLDPYADPQGSGYHMIQSMAAVAGGGLAGRGLGNGIQKLGYLPEDTNDFVFAVICEELGVMGAGLVIVLYAALCLCGLAIVRGTRRRFEALLGLGILATIGMQALINLAVVTGCGPTKGIALPLISAGGTGWVLTAFCIGLLVAMQPPAEEDSNSRFEI